LPQESSRESEFGAAGNPVWTFVGFVLALLVALKQHGYYFEIILPGSLVGMIVGWATQKYGAVVQTKKA